MTDIPILLVVATLAGAGINVLRGALQQPKTEFSFRKLAGGLIAAIFGALAIVSTIDITNIGGPIALVILGLLTGFGSDFALSKLKK